MPSVHILDMNCAARANARLDVHGFVRDAGLPRECVVSHGGIADQKYVRYQHRLQVLRQLACADRAAACHEITGLPVAVARDENAVELPADTTTAGPAATPARRATQVP